MTKTSIRRSIKGAKILVTAVLAGALVSSAHGRSVGEEKTPESRSWPGGIQVYVADFELVQADQSPATTELRDFASFVGRMVYFRLLEVPTLNVHQTSSPACGAGEGSQGAERAVAVQQTPASAKQPGENRAPDFYSIRASAESKAPNFIVDYLLERCEGGKFSTLLHQREPIAVTQAIDETMVLASYLAYRLQSEVPHINVRVEPFEAQGTDREQAAEATKRLAAAIAGAPDLAIGEPAEYIIRGELVASRGVPIPILDRFTRGAPEARIFIRPAQGKERWLKPIQSKHSSPNEFLTTVADTTLQRLTEMRIAERLHWDQWLGEMETSAELFPKAEALLCLRSAPGCRRDREAALAVLVSIKNRDPDNVEALMLLGKTQLELGRDGDAVQSLVRAKELTAEDRESIDRHVEVNLLLAEAAGKTGDNKRVSECYDELLSVDPTVQSFYMQKAQAEQYAGEHIAALGTLLTGIAYATDSSSLHLEAKRLIRSLEAEDFEPAEKLFRQLQANKEQLKDETALYEWRRGSYRLDWSDPDSLERAKGRFTEALALDPKDPSILANLYGFLVLVNSYKDNTAAEGYLAKIDSLPTVDLAKEIREWLMRVRASYLLSKGKDFYGDAYSVAKQGRAINDSKQAELLQAQTATLTARNRDTLMEIERTARYEEAHDLVLPLARERYASLADAILSEVNRNLNRNQETQVLFTSLVEKNPKDLPAVQGLMEVCAEYLFDFQCALNAALRYAAAMPAGAKMDVGQQINTAEAGTLTGNLELANQWLASALSDNGLPQDLRAVAFLYRTWVSAVSTTSDDLREPFEQWREATGELRRRGTPLGWSFRGAKHALERGSMNEKHRNLLHQMIATLEDASSPLPEWAP